LRSAPFYLTWGSTVIVRITASNINGNSVVTTSGSGAVILTYPDAPVNLQTLIQYTSGTQISLSWLQGAQNGGSAIIDYTLMVSQNNVTFIE